jgi:O-antigen/teichoic acid export membrane protein
VACRVAFQFAISVALARLVTPQEFGVFAIASVFTGIAVVIIDGGFGAALVQKTGLSNDDYSTIFHFQWALALFIGVILSVAASFIANFYAYAKLQPLLFLAAINLVLSALGGVHQSLLTKALKFKALTIAGLSATLSSGILAVALALDGFGVWALAIQTISATLVYVVLLWILDPWRPDWIFRPRLLRKTLSFGGYLLLSGLLDALYGRSYGLFIGKLFGAAELGQYARANATQGMPMGLITGIIGRVALPAFAAVQDDQARLRSGMRKALQGATALNSAAMFGLIAVADTLVSCAFGQAWRPSVPLLRILCLAGALYPLHLLNVNIIIAQGHSALFFRIEVLKKCIGIVGVLIAVPFGLEAVAWSQVGITAAWFAIHAFYTKRLLGYGALAQLKDCLPFLTAGVVMGFSVWLLPNVTSLPIIATLLVQIFVGAVVYCTLWALWDQSLIREFFASLLPSVDQS